MDSLISFMRADLDLITKNLIAIHGAIITLRLDISQEMCKIVSENYNGLGYSLADERHWQWGKDTPSLHKQLRQAKLTYEKCERWLMETHRRIHQFSVNIMRPTPINPMEMERALTDVDSIAFTPDIDAHLLVLSTYGMHELASMIRTSLFTLQANLKSAVLTRKEKGWFKFERNLLTIQHDLNIECYHTTQSFYRE